MTEGPIEQAQQESNPTTNHERPVAHVVPLRISPSILSNPPSLEEITYFPATVEEMSTFEGLSTPQLISRTLHRLATEMPDVARLTVEVNGADFLFFSQSAQLNPPLQGAIEIPETVAKAMLYGSQLSIKDRTMQCIKISEELIRQGNAGDHMKLEPQTLDNMRGSKSFHYIAGMQLPDGRYVYMDASYPYPRNMKQDRQEAQAIPHGTFIMGSSKADADRIVNLVYGAVPTKDN